MADILIVEDELHIAEGVRDNLIAEGHDVDMEANGTQALDRIRRTRYDLIILDIMLPGTDGWTICETARAEGIQTPILFLTARSDPGDRVRGLEAGGDDYLPKPFHLKELLLRVSAILRRSQWYAGTIGNDAVRTFGGNTIDFQAFTGRSADGQEHVLGQREAMILRLLMDREGEVVTREDILETVWGEDVYPSTRVIETFVHRLRKRFEVDPEAPRYVHTVRGVGYTFTGGVED